MEDYVADAPEPEQAAAARELLRVEAHYRRRMGEELQPTDFQTRLPMLALSDITLALAVAPSPADAPTRWEPPDRSDSPSDTRLAQLPGVPGYEIPADFYRVAAENDARVFAHNEAAALARRGLALVQTLPDTPAANSPCK